MKGRKKQNDKRPVRAEKIPLGDQGIAPVIQDKRPVRESQRPERTAASVNLNKEPERKEQQDDWVLSMDVSLPKKEEKKPMPPTPEGKKGRVPVRNFALNEEDEVDVSYLYEEEEEDDDEGFLDD